MISRVAEKNLRPRLAARICVCGILALSMLVLAGCSDLFSVQPLATVATGNCESATFGSAGAEFRDKNSLEGIWTGNDGGTYQIQQ